MLKITSGDMFRAGAALLVNPVNCVGVAGKGLALAFKHRFPASVARYTQLCVTGQMSPGQVLMTFMEGQWIAHFPTKRHWRDNSLLVDIEDGLVSLRRQLDLLQPLTVAVPALGCGEGGLAWEDVLPCIQSALATYDEGTVWVYEPR